MYGTWGNNAQACLPRTRGACTGGQGVRVRGRHPPYSRRRSEECRPSELQTTLRTRGRLLKGYRGGHVVIRFALGGCTNRPFFRIVAAHSRRARDGKYLEQLGCLDPLPNAYGEKVAGLNLERLRHWLGCGAQLSRPAEKLLGRYTSCFLGFHLVQLLHNSTKVRQRQVFHFASC
uniref:Small ribosomal subunit protein bS16m n=1 Tax=Falco tinnunculus TaxID=100819 RepID=A0A8C4UX52_FALTI